MKKISILPKEFKEIFKGIGRLTIEKNKKDKMTKKIKRIQKT